MLALLPLLLTLRRTGSPRGRRDAALSLHRAQLIELDRELSEGRIGDAEHAGARLEVQRRLLAAADQSDDAVTTASGGRASLFAALILVPLAAGGLYLINGQPDMPAGVVPTPATEAGNAEADRLIAALRSKLAVMDPQTSIAGQGYILLGNAEVSRGHLAAAAEAWRAALQAGFNPALAAQAAEAQTQAEGKVSAETAALFRRALAEAPPDAPWRELVQQRLGTAGGG